MKSLLVLLALLARMAATGRSREALRLVRRWWRVRTSGLFDPGFYAARYPDVAAGALSPLHHFVAWGLDEGRQPHRLVDPVWYAARYPDIQDSGQDAFSHYLRSGWRERRNPSPYFDVEYYLTRYPEVAAGGTEPLRHYLRHGARHRPNPLFDGGWYLDSYPATARSQPLLHYLDHGCAAGHLPLPPDEWPFRDVTPAGIDALSWHLCGWGEPIAAAPTDGATTVCLVTQRWDGGQYGVCASAHLRAVALAEAGLPVVLILADAVAGASLAQWRRRYEALGIRLVALAELPESNLHTTAEPEFLRRSHRLFRHLSTGGYAAIFFEDRGAAGYWTIMAKQLGLAFAATRICVFLQGPSRWLADTQRQFPADALAQAKLEWCEAFCLAHADTTISVSRQVLGWAEQAGLTLATDCRLIPHLSPPVVAVPRPHDPGHIVFLGPLDAGGGLELLMDAIRRLAARGGRLPRQVTLLGRPGHVRGLPVETYVARAGVLGLPVVIEACDDDTALKKACAAGGLVVLAAMPEDPGLPAALFAAGVPLIAPAIGGLEEMLDDRILYAPQASALAALLARCHELPFADLTHPDPQARRAWLELDREAVLAVKPEPDGPAPLVTVCVPYFEHGAYLGGLVEALRSQSHGNFEAVIVNDGSGPEATAAFEGIAAACGDGRFRFLTTANGGPGHARNHAVANGTGEFLVFVDADNLPKDDQFLARLVAAARHSGADCITVPHDAVDQRLMTPGPSDIRYRYRPFGGCVSAAFFENVLGDATMIVRRSVFEALGGFPESRETWEDWQFLLRLVLAGHDLKVYPYALYYYRVALAGRSATAVTFDNYDNLLSEMRGAPQLREIVRRIALPSLAKRP